MKKVLFAVLAGAMLLGSQASVASDNPADYRKFCREYKKSKHHTFTEWWKYRIHCEEKSTDKASRTGSPSPRSPQTPVVPPPVVTKEKGNNGIGNGLDPQPPGGPKPNDTDL